MLFRTQIIFCSSELRLHFRIAEVGSLLSLNRAWRAQVTCACVGLRVRTYVFAQVRAYVNLRICLCMHVWARMRVRVRLRVCARVRECVRACVHTHTHAQPHAQMRARPHAYAHVASHIGLHTHMHMLACAH